MSGKDKGPAWRPPFGLPRPATDRDVYQDKHSTGIPEEAWDDPTGRCEGEALQRARQRRPTPERVARLETKHDALALTVANMDGKLDAMLGYAARSDAERERRVAAEALALEKRRAHWIALIKVIGGLIVAAIAALVTRGAL